MSENEGSKGKGKGDLSNMSNWLHLLTTDSWFPGIDKQGKYLVGVIYYLTSGLLTRGSDGKGM